MELRRSNSSDQSSAANSAAVEAAVFQAVETLNQTLAKTQQLKKSRDVVLIDTGSTLDSMAVVNLVVFVEDEVAQRFGRQLDLTGEDPFSEDELKTLGAMIDGLCRKLA